MTSIRTSSHRRHRRTLETRVPRAIALLLMIGLSAAAPSTAETEDAVGSPSLQRAYPMNAENWTMEPPIGWAGHVTGSATFARYEGMPTGTMTLNEGLASLPSARFSEGSIDFDIKPIGYDDAGLIFHRNGVDDGEFVYVRANPDCPAADDCVQYAPITHMLMQWNIYPNYQGPAPLLPTGWNHVSVQVANGTMLVYVNHAAEPSIVVPRLRGLQPNGGIAFKGPAIFANLVIRPHAKPDIRRMAAEYGIPGTVTKWLAATPTEQDRARAVSAEEIPHADAWHGIEVEPTGLVNLSRAFGQGRAPSLSTAWLKTIAIASGPMRRNLHLGFAMQASVFLNGRLVYSGNNPYYPEKDRISPEGRIQIDNAIVPLDLRKGRNEIVLAIGNDWRVDLPVPKPSQYGWAAEARFDRIDGLALR